MESEIHIMKVTMTVEGQEQKQDADLFVM